MCLVAPYADATTELRVSSNRPMLVWQGVADRVALQRAGTSDILWSRPVTEADQLIEEVIPGSPIYGITPDIALQPGESYNLLLSFRQFAPRSFRFRVMDTAERDRLSTELAQVERAIAQENLSGKAAIARRADYYASQQLWSEFWAVVRSDPHPSPDWKALQRNVVSAVCPLVNTSGRCSDGHATRTPDNRPYRDHSFTLSQPQTVEILAQSTDFDMQISLLRSPSNSSETSSETSSAEQNWELIQAWSHAQSSVEEPRQILHEIALSEPGNHILRVQAADPQQRGEYQLWVTAQW
ncbi:hypothetical protein HPC62_11820 [Thermoleptolyngbya sichuanensis A183]|uniref:DUF928 domain-containing protein n=1 Tax=Thermoleptolyngbya sichuanensis A183 TaxID=2737172 RepID=A0A6M8BEU8_9CYAN|nr:hypothetical protein [Thermoleptolyngbya sichuanensis]QKD82780.1 hypothetical protein HPC62_11820 [Thermoleptolyngbya sichuanensis A183]